MARLQRSPIWYQGMTPDPGGARAFYGEVVGSTIGDGQGDRGYATIARIGAAMGAGDQPPGWLHHFRVADIDAPAAKVRSGGGVALNGPHPVPGGEQVLIGTDPQGVRVGCVAAPEQGARG